MSCANRHPEIDWAAVAAAGNVYRHEYEAVDESSDLAHYPDPDLAALRRLAGEELDRARRSASEGE